MLKLTEPGESPAYRIGGMAFVLALGVILTALGFEYIGGYPPCPLCLMQRWAYYAGIPILFVATAFASERPRLASALFFAVGLMFVANAVLGGYHAGVEWKFWEGPQTCAGGSALPITAGDLAADMENRVVRCDEAAWRLFGLSFAGWNVVLSLVLSLLGFQAASATRRVY